MPTEVTAALTNCNIFAAVKGDGQKRLVKMALRRNYGAGKLIFRQGNPVPGVFIVAQGLVRIFKLAPNGKEHVLHLAGPGATFAEAAALGQFPCPAFAETLEETTCILLPTAPFNAALREDHELCLQIVRSLAGWTKNIVNLLESLVLRDAAGRVAAYLLQLEAKPAGAAEAASSRRRPGRAISLPSLKKHVASHLNLTSETLSRTLRQLREENLIDETADHRLIVKDNEGLQRVAEGFFPRL